MQHGISRVVLGNAIIVDNHYKMKRLLLDFDRKELTLDEDVNLFELLNKVQTHIPNWDEWTLKVGKITTKEQPIQLGPGWYNNQLTLPNYGVTNLASSIAQSDNVLKHDGSDLSWSQVQKQKHELLQKTGKVYRGGDSKKVTMDPHRLNRKRTGRFGAGDTGITNMSQIPQEAKKALEEIGKYSSTKENALLSSFMVTDKVDGKKVYSGQLLAEFK